MGELPEDFDDQVRQQAAMHVDPETFLFYSRFYAAAAQAIDAQQFPGGGLYAGDADGCWAFESDVEMANGMRAVSGEMRKNGVSDDLRYAMLLRLMHLGDVRGAAELEPFVSPAPQAGGTILSAALLKACAVAQFVFGNDSMDLDLADVARWARQYADEEKNPRPS
jgi:hypothetical protein